MHGSPDRCNHWHLSLIHIYVDSLKLEAIGPAFEHHANFPERINTEFVQVVDAAHLKMRVWERGSGETWACGTGTCATVAALTELGICPAGQDVHLPVSYTHLLCDTIAFLHKGRLLLCEDKDTLREEYALWHGTAGQLEELDKNASAP